MLLLLSTLLIKPVHVAIVHHDYSCYHDDSRNSSLSHKDCDICQFVFSNYIPQQAGNFTPFIHRPFITLAERAEVYHTTQSIRFFSLRAPPAQV